MRRDDEEALRWYRRAAEQGYALGQYVLGLRYEQGRGVQQDYEEAVRWHRRAAEQGHARGQNNLGVMYERGRGVRRDEEEAVHWYRRTRGRLPAALRSLLDFRRNEDNNDDYR